MRPGIRVRRRSRDEELEDVDDLDGWSDPARYHDTALGTRRSAGSRTNAMRSPAPTTGENGWVLSDDGPGGSSAARRQLTPTLILGPGFLRPEDHTIRR